MPRTVEEILSQADKLARRFENGELSSPTTLDGAALRDVRHAFDDVARAEQRLAEAVTVARGYGHPWAAIGAMLGTSGEAARQRYGTKRPAPEAGGDDGHRSAGRRPLRQSRDPGRAAGPGEV